jgi:EAL domain-containing protein (putative c-di-GMP-specific phosphodiesterase class I)
VSAGAWPLWRTGLAVPGLAPVILVLAAALTAAISLGAVLLSGRPALLLDNLQEIVASLGGACALVAAMRGAQGRARFLRAMLAVSLGSAALGQVVWDIAPAGSTPILGEVLLLGGALLGAAAVLPAVFGGLERRRLLGAALDGLLLFLTGAALVTVVIHPAALQTGGWIGGLGVVVTVASAGACSMALMGRQVRPSLTGPWAILAGAMVSAAADFMYSTGVLLLAHGAISWQPRASSSARYRRFARAVEVSLPSGAILLAVSLGSQTLAPSIDHALHIVVGAVFGVAALRQLHLQASARASQEAELRAARRLDRYRLERHVVTATLASLTASDSIVETARRICRVGLRLEGIDLVTVRLVNAHGDVVPLAMEGMDGRLDDLVGRALPGDRTESLFRHLADGPFIETFGPGGKSHDERLHAAGLRGTVSAALYRDERLIGILEFGTRSADAVETLAEQRETAGEFAVVAAALLGPTLAAWEGRENARARIRDIIDQRAFVPVFQPIVEIASGSVIGFEALTRFADGLRPDLRFAEAAAAGLGAQLEMACLRAAVTAATDLPSDGWLSLNASPALATDLLSVLSIISESRRRVVLEITEHVPIDDYGALVEALRTLGGDVRVSVDDAGAGYAGLTHILELRPDFVKLDIALVRSIDTDLARRALVRSMVWFARETGCHVIAEGIETEGELAALAELGVELGQGFLLARPATALDLRSGVGA